MVEKTPQPLSNPTWPGETMRSPASRTSSLWSRKRCISSNLSFSRLNGFDGGADRPRADRDHGQERSGAMRMRLDFGGAQDRDVARFAVQHQRVLFIRSDGDES